MTIEVGNFAKLRNDSLAEYGLHKGDHVYLAGNGFVRTSESDPFKYRLIFVGAPIKDGHIDLTVQGLTIDGKNLKIATKAMTAKLEKNKDADFNEQAKQAPATDGVGEVGAISPDGASA